MSTFAEIQRQLTVLFGQLEDDPANELQGLVSYDGSKPAAAVLQRTARSCTVDFDFGTATQLTTGEPGVARHRVFGSLVADFMVPEGQADGGATLLELCDAAADLLRSKLLTANGVDVTLLAPTIGSAVAEDGWRKRATSVTFYADFTPEA